MYGGGAVGGLVTPDVTDLERASLPFSSCPCPNGTPSGTGTGAASGTGGGIPRGYNPVFHGASLPPIPGAAGRINGALVASKSVFPLDEVIGPVWLDIFSIPS